MDSIQRKLLKALDECNIEKFDMDSVNKTLTIRYKEDFDEYFPKFDVEPYILNPKQSGAPFTPYHFGKIAYFHYEDWTIKGMITIRKKQ